MAELNAAAVTTISSEDVMVQAVRTFTNSRFRVQSQTNRIATFVGRAKFPIVHVFVLAFLAFFFVIPAIIYWFIVVRKVWRMESIAVTTNPGVGGCGVHVSYPKSAEKAVVAFIASLPKAQTKFAGIGM